MPEDIVALNNFKILKIISYDNVCENDLMTSFQVLKYYYQTEGYRKVLVDISKLNPLINSDGFLSLVPLELTDLYIAYICKYNSKILESIETLAKQQDFAFIHYFITEKEAIDW